MVITIIGMSLFPVTADWAMGGATAGEDYGSLKNIALAAITLVILLALSKSGVPALSRLSILLSIVLGTVVAAFMGLAEARNDRFMLGVDLTYTNVSKSVKTPFGILADKIDVTNTSLMLTGLAGYAIYHSDMARLDAVAGARLWSVNNEFDLKGGLLDGRSKSDGASWVDPLVGAKLRVDVLPDVYVAGWAMIGGFGVGSDLMWDLMGGAGYDFTEHVSAFAGYRAASVNYSNDGFVYDVVEQGPVIAAVFKF